MDENNVAIEVKDLFKAFRVKKKTYEVLKGVNFQVRKGQVFCLLGSNGAGKTTIVKILSTLTTPDRCDISVCGFDLVKKPHMVREVISLTGQYAAVDEILTGRENMRLVAELRHIKNSKEKIAELLELFELSAAADKRVKTYSGGMKRKVDIAMSLLGDPEIIFLDEPTTGLDPQSRLALWGTIENLKKDGKTIFLTTQYLDEAERLSDYVAVLDGGIIVSGGTPRELKESFKKIEAAKYEYEKEMPTLEDVFLSIVTKKKEGDKK